MVKNSIPTDSMTPTVYLKIAGNLSLEGVDRPEIAIEDGDNYSLKLEKLDEGYYVTCRQDCLVTVPAQAKLLIDKIGGNSQIRSVTGDLFIHRVGGNLSLENMGDVRIERVGGNSHLQNLSGNLILEKVGGELEVNGLQGTLKVNKVGGNLTLNSGVCEDLDVTTGGNAILQFTGLKGKSINVSAGGVIWCQMPDGAGIHAFLRSGTSNITVYSGSEKTLIEEEYHELTQEDGAITADLRAGGDVFFGGSAMESTMQEALSGAHGTNFDWAGFGQDIERSIREGLEAAGLDDRFGERMSRHAQRIAERAEAQARAAGERAEARARAAMQQFERRGGMGWNWGNVPDRPPVPPVRPRPGHEPVSEDERLLVLQMLKDHKISLEEAQRLLDALESQEG